MNDLIEKFERWLAEHCQRMRTAAGTISTRAGVPQYEMPDDAMKLFGGHTVGEVERLRRGKDMPYSVTQRVEELVEAWDIPAIVHLRRDQGFARDLESAIGFNQKFGRAPDGKSLQVWARRVRRRFESSYECYEPLAGEALALWLQAFPEELPKNNRLRRERHAA